MQGHIKQELQNSQDILKRIAEGDEQAFTTLFSFWQPRLLRYVLPFALSYPNAKDVVQDVLFKIWCRRETLVGIVSLENYLHRMAKNQVLDLFRKEAVTLKHVSQLSIKESESAQVEEDLLLKEYHQVAREAINKLPPKQKQIFLLRRQEDMTLDEIAFATSTSREAVQKNLTRATLFVKNYLRSHGEWTLPFLYLFVSTDKNFF